MQSASLYIASGATDDYCFSRWFTAATAGTPVSPVMAFTIEVGGDPGKGADQNEGGFSPNYVTQYPKLEREIHVAAWAFLSAVSSTAFVGPQAPPAPAPPPPRTSGGSGCRSMFLIALGGGPSLIRPLLRRAADGYRGSC